MRITAIFLAVLLTASVGAQSIPPGSPQDAEFEVISIRPSTNSGGMMTVQVLPGRFVASNVPVELLLITAYNVRPENIRNAPAWTHSEAFHVEGTIRSGKRPSRDELSVLLRSMLASRFKLSVREMSVEESSFRLVLDRADRRAGAQLRPSVLRCEDVKPAGGPAAAATASRSGALTPSECQLRSDEQGTLTGRGLPISRLAQALSSSLGSEVLDATGLEGRYDFDLSWLPEQKLGNRDRLEPQLLPDRPMLFTAMKEQLGLRLEPSKSGKGAIIVEHIERPAAN